MVLKSKVSRLIALSVLAASSLCAGINDFATANTLSNLSGQQKSKEVMMQDIENFGGKVIPENWMDQEPNQENSQENANGSTPMQNQIKLGDLSFTLLKDAQQEQEDINEKVDHTPQLKSSELELLSSEHTEFLLSTLPALSSGSADLEKQFSWLKGPKLPENTTLNSIDNWQQVETKTIPTDLGPEQQRPSIEEKDKPLLVSLFSPKGKINNSTYFNIGFSKPMYAVGERPEPDAEQPLAKVKLRIEPEVAGSFTWLDPYNLIFTVDGNFPFAQGFEVTLLPETEDVFGHRLAEKHSFEFETKPLNLDSIWPASYANLSVDSELSIITQQPVFILDFNAPVSETELLSKAYLLAKDAKGNSSAQKIALQLASKEELANDALFQFEKARHLDCDEQVNFQYCLSPKTPLIRGQVYELHIDEALRPAHQKNGIASTQAVSRLYKVHSDLKLKENTCGSSNPCHEYSDFEIEFNQELLPDCIHLSDLEITPAIDELDLNFRANSIYLRGDKQPETEYTVKIKKDVKDIFSNSLKAPIELSFITAERPYYGHTIVTKPFVTTPTSTEKYHFFSNRLNKLELKVYRVRPEDYHQYLAYEAYVQAQSEAKRHSYKVPLKVLPPGRLIHSDSIEIAQPKQFTIHSLALAPLLENKAGHLLIELSGEDIREDRGEQINLVWLQVTDIAMSYVQDRKQLHAKVYELQTAQALEDLKLDLLLPSKKQAQQVNETPKQATEMGFFEALFAEPSPIDTSTSKTSSVLFSTSQSDEYGLAQLRLPEPEHWKELLLVASNKHADSQDMAFLPIAEHSRQYLKAEIDYFWYVTDDRNLYRPGESVSIKGWLRRFDPRENGQILLPEGPVQALQEQGNGEEIADEIAYKLYDSRHEVIAEGSSALTPLGGFDLEFNLDEEAELGSYSLELSYNNSREWHHFKVEEYRRPEFEISLSPQRTDYIAKQHLNVEAQAKYFSGEALAHSDISWLLSTYESLFAPASWPQYYFGQQDLLDPYLRGHKRRKASRRHSLHFPAPSYQYEDTTDSNGQSVLSLQLDNIQTHATLRMNIEAAVEDLNRQKFASSSSIIIHPSQYYVGLNIDSRYVEENKSLSVQSIVTDTDGKVREGLDYQLEIIRHFNHSAETVKSCQLVSTARAQKCISPELKQGSYQVISSITDEEGRKQVTRMSVFVGQATSPSIEGSDSEGRISFTEEGNNWQVGQEFSIMLNTPFNQQELPALLSLDLVREGVLERKFIKLSQPMQRVRFKLKEHHAPGFTLVAHGVGKVSDAGLPQIHTSLEARGQQYFAVKSSKKELELNIELDKPITTPGSEVELNISVQNEGQNISGAELAVFVVDEAVLAASGYEHPSLAGAFYKHWDSGTLEKNLRDYLYKPLSDEDLQEQINELNDEMALSKAKKSFSKAMRTRSASPQSDAMVQMRKNFAALALFAPSALSNEQGKATLKFTLPDSLTSYRVVVLAVHNNDYFGMGNDKITTKKTVNIRPMPPRFAYVDDEFNLPFIVQNSSDVAQDFELAVRASSMEFEHQALSFSLEPQQRTEISFPVIVNKAGQVKGQALLRVMKDGLVGEYDAVEFNFPVYRALQAQHEAIYGEISGEQQAQKQPLSFPKKALAGFGGIDLNYSSTAISHLQDAYDYLVEYPYNCSEQLSSKVIALSQLGSLLHKFKQTDNKQKAQHFAQIKEAVKELLSRQQSSGGFTLWSSGSRVHHYASIHTLHALILARQLGIEVDEDKLQSGMNYLASLVEEEHSLASDISKSSQNLLKAQAIYVQYLYYSEQKAVPRFPESLLNQISRLYERVEAELDQQLWPTLAWLVMSMEEGRFAAQSNALLAHINNHIEITASSAHLTKMQSRDDYVHMASNRKDDAIVLQALLMREPESAYLVKLVRGLLDKRTQGRWLNTQENVHVILALKQYFEKRESTEPKFVVDTWLGQNYAGQEAFSGYSTQEKQTHIPEALLPRKEQNLIIQKTGEGTLYYRAGINYALDARDASKARSQGFVISRTYESAENDPQAVIYKNGQWHIKAGSLVRIKLSMKVPSIRYYVALVDPLPAGFEAVNSALANTASADEVNGSLTRKGLYYWHNHQNLRDERLELFSDEVAGGKYEYSYLVRATSKGQFIAPAAHIEEMYHPENYAQSESELLVIK